MNIAIYVRLSACDEDKLYKSEYSKSIDLDNLDAKAIRGIIDKIEAEPIKEEGMRIRKDFNIYFTYANIDSVIKEFIEK